MKRSGLLFIQSALCVLSAIALIVAALLTCFEGRAAGASDPMADIYTVEAIADKAVFVLPFLCASVIVTVICALLGVKAAETGKVPENISVGKNTGDEKIQTSKMRILRAAIILLAVILIMVGIFNGSLNDVFIKASKICTECIGLG